MLFGPQLFVTVTVVVVVPLRFVVSCAFCVALVFFSSSRMLVTVVAKQRRLWQLRRADTRKNETRRGDATRCVGSALVSRFTVRKQLFSFFLFIYFFRRDFN